MAKYSININELAEYADTLRAGDEVLLSGIAYTSRDAAHKRIFSLLDSGEALPFDLKGACIYLPVLRPLRRAQLSAAAARLPRAGWMSIRRGCSISASPQ